MSDSLVERLRSLYDKHFNTVGELSDEVLTKAFRELGESDDTKRKCLKELREMISKKGNAEYGEQVSVLFGEQSDEYLLRFLRARKYEVSRSYDMMIEFSRYRDKYPEISQKLSAENVKESLQHGFPGLLPFRDKKGRATLAFSAEHWNPKHIPFDTIICAYIYLLEHMSVNEETQINGFVIVHNMTGCSMMQMLAVKLNQVKKLVALLQDAFPGRFKGIHFIFEPWYFRWLYNFIKPFLKEKIARRVHMHGTNLTGYYTEFDSDFLPELYGGKGPAYRSDIMLASVTAAANSKTAGFKKLVKRAFSFF